MLLTISLLCCGRDKSTEKCLKSVREIADKIGDSEIIVVDTGCGEAMRKLLNAYADKVIPFTWCNDFSAARNVGVDAASGEWFMFIDDDEWFEDPTALIAFFTSGKYLNYTSATYGARNYGDPQGSFYEDCINSRIYKIGNKDKHRFIGKVHEYFNAIPGQRFFIDCYTEHYGYAYANEEERNAHSLRNVPLILEMINEDPLNIRWPQQLVAEYHSLKEYKKLKNLCTKTIHLIANRNDTEANTIRPLFYCAKILADYFLKEYEDAHDTYCIGISDTRNAAIARARLLGMGTKIMWEFSKEYKAIINNTDEYLALYNNCDFKVETNNNPVFLINEAFDTTHYDEVLIYGTLAAIHLNLPDKATYYFDKIVWSIPNNKITISAAIIDIIDELALANYNKFYQPIFLQLLSSPISRNLCLNRIEQICLNDFQNILTINNYAIVPDYEFDLLRFNLCQKNITNISSIDFSSFDELYETFKQWSNSASILFENHIKNTSNSSITAELLVALNMMDFITFAGDDYHLALNTIKENIGICPSLDSSLVFLSQQYGKFLSSLINE